MSQSSLVNYTLISPFQTKPRAYPITKITIHHMAGNLTVEQCGKLFQSRQACSNYGIDNKGRVGQYCLEENRAWCSANYDNDHRAINIELANDGGAPNWHVSDTVLNKCVELCVDICKRNGISSLNWTGDKNGNLTIHQFFCATTCPGPYLKSKMPWIAAEVNSRLKSVQPISKNPILLDIGPASSGDLKQFQDLLTSLQIGYDIHSDHIITNKKVSSGDQLAIVSLGNQLNVNVVEYIPTNEPVDDSKDKEYLERIKALEGKFEALQKEYNAYRAKVQTIAGELLK